MTECGVESWSTKDLDEPWRLVEKNGHFKKYECTRERAEYKDGSDAPMCAEHMKEWNKKARVGIQTKEQREEAAREWVEENLGS